MPRLIRTIAVVLLAAMVCEAVPVALLADEERTAVAKVRFEVNGELVNVYYELQGPESRVHKVRLVLLRETDSLFLYHPVNVTGDIGAVIFPGQRRRIVWDFTKEFPEGLTGNDFYFSVEAEAVQTEGINPLYWIGGGVAVLGGALVLLLGGKKTTPPVEGGFPAPPGRPQ